MFSNFSASRMNAYRSGYSVQDAQRFKVPCRHRSSDARQLVPRKVSREVDACTASTAFSVWRLLRPQLI